jgi:hypothetical protein
MAPLCAASGRRAQAAAEDSAAKGGVNECLQLHRNPGVRFTVGIPPIWPGMPPPMPLPMPPPMPPIWPGMPPPMPPPMPPRHAAGHPTARPGRGLGALAQLRDT